MSDVETPIVIEDAGLVPTKTPGTSVLDRWLATSPEQALTRVDALVTILDKLRRAAIRSTYAGDWVIHVSRDSDGNILRQAGYLQDCGAERAGKVWGIDVSAPAVEREDFPDHTYAYHMVADAVSKVTGERLTVEGSRWSGDAFFARREKGPDEKIDPVDVRKAAWANTHGRAVRALAGLTAVPLEELREAGIDPGKVLMVDYAKGSRGGESTGAAVGSADMIVGWGNAKGQKIPELTDKDLAYYAKATQESLEDPARAKFRKRNEQFLAALTAETARRKAAEDQRAETGTPTTEEQQGQESRRGARINTLNTLLSDACKGHRPAIAAVLGTLTKDHGGVEIRSLSNLTDDMLDYLLTIPADVLAKVALSVGEAKR